MSFELSIKVHELGVYVEVYVVAPTTVFQTTPNLECFEKIYYFSRIPRQSCYNLVIKNFQGQKVFD